MKRLGFLFFLFFCVITIEARPPQGLKFESLNFVPPAIVEKTLSSGTTLYLLEDHELPLIQINIAIKTGSMYEPLDRVGLASLCSTLLRTGGSTHSSSDAINDDLETMGATIEMGMDVESASVSLSVLNSDLNRGLSLLFEMLRTPRFDKKKLEIEKAKLIESIRRRNDEPFQIARREIRKILYGPNHPLSRTPEIPSIKKIERKDLKAFYKRYYCPNNMRIAVSGNFKSEEIIKKLESALSGWKNEPIAYPNVPTIDSDSTANVMKRYVGLAERNLSQASVILAQLGIKRHNPDRFALEVMNEILGGSAFTSRLYKEVRSRRGLVYWIGSNFSEPWDTGTLGIGCQTKNKSVGEVLETVEHIVTELIESPVPEEELQAAKDAIINSFIFRYANSQAILTQKMMLDYFGYPSDHLETYTERISKITAADVQKVAKKYLKPKKMAILVVGQSKEFDLPRDRCGEVKNIDLNIDE